jgi:hypothetical protein
VKKKLKLEAREKRRLAQARSGGPAAEPPGADPASTGPTLQGSPAVAPKFDANGRRSNGCSQWFVPGEVSEEAFRTTALEDTLNDLRNGPDQAWLRPHVPDKPTRPRPWAEGPTVDSLINPATGGRFLQP